MTLTVKDAPRAARELTKRTAYLRKILSTASKAEEAGTQGATEERERLTATFNRDIKETERLIRDTECHADAFDRAALCLRNPNLPASDALSRLTRTAALLGLPAARVSAVGDLLTHAAQRGRDSAEKSQARLDASTDDIAATRTLGAMLARLPHVGWDIKRVHSLRKEYQRHLGAAKGNRP
ncbi:hypothetical protein [Falsiruegeria mediterranea]|uniref:hypothetical protein n=1 Tax=Falsiruegeria mediterranea TaxID=1280832 RepID=UPI0015F26A77|nr:hypothetical protein [Falsiruegeria mediterranea]